MYVIVLPWTAKARIWSLTPDFEVLKRRWVAPSKLQATNLEKLLAPKVRYDIIEALVKRKTPHTCTPLRDTPYRR